VTQILPGLHVGDFNDGGSWGGVSVCVLEGHCGHPNCQWVRILTDAGGRVQAAWAALEMVATIYDANEKNGAVLLHCGAGIERSPLAAAYILVTRHGMTWQSAYALLQSKRPQVQDRTAWLPRP
jgi:Dual specificity phosphatase, catalytic domain